MNSRSMFLAGVGAAATLALSACGGDGMGIASTPPPPVTPTPPTTPTPPPATPPTAPAHLGLVSGSPFAVLSVGETYETDGKGNVTTVTAPPAPQNVQFSYDAVSNSYQISLPGFQPGKLVTMGYNGSSGQPATSSSNQVTAGPTSTLQPAYVQLFVPGTSFSPYTYTSLGSWSGQTWTTTSVNTQNTEGIFAYGIPTQVGDVPVTGTATYAANIFGSIGGGWTGELSGTASLSFDFGAGKLSGSMHAGVFDTFDGIVMDFGTYPFKQTVYSTGSTTFSGKFDIQNLPNADSFFDGSFNGPGASELMARFAAPYLFNGQQGTMWGVWIGKKGN